MYKKHLLLLSLLLSSFAALLAQLRSPNDFLPHQLGENFTPHHLLVDYMEHTAANSDKVQLTRMGTTTEGRPQLLAFVSTPENLARLEAIRQNNLKKTGLIPGSPDPSLDVAIVWLGFSVHGNEAAGSESSMAVIYELARPDNPETAKWLQNTLVIIDPSQNPDGYSRYTSWYRDIAPAQPDPNPEAREHVEPWPGGRVNHYLFDLNRDWAWQTQQETQNRIRMFLQWLPHIHPDIHEQGYNSNYYFAPAAQPYHKYLSEWQRSFQFTIGKNNAKHFDEQGWLYYTRQVFDLLYPSYGDTYPMFHGGIGMTYEQAGIRAGRAITLESGDTLTLLDRIMHHKTAALSTVEVASQNASEIIKNFEAYYQQYSSNPPGAYKTYVIKGNNPQDKIKSFCELLDKNQIKYGTAAKATTLNAFDYQTGRETNIQVVPGDLLISAYQPFAVFTQVLMDPSTEVVDSNTYDITAWSLPYAYGLEAYAGKQKIEVSAPFQFKTVTAPNIGTQKPYAFLVRWEGLKDARFLAALLQAGVKVRFANDPFQLEDNSFDRGTLIITREDNRKQEDLFLSAVTRLAADHQQELFVTYTGFTNNGKDLGSSFMSFLDAPKVAVLSGTGVNSTSFGQIWYFFERDLGYPVHIHGASELGRFDLSAYHVLIMPEGSYRLSDSQQQLLNEWVGKGGKVIAVGSATNAFSNREGFSLKPYASKETEAAAKKRNEQAMLDHRLDDFGGQTERYLSNSIPGAIVKLTMDNTHPLAYGMPNYYFTLKAGESTFEHLADAWNVGYLKEDLFSAGFIGAGVKDQLKNTTTFAVEDKGRGAIVYMVDNPLFRAFWENGKFLFSNAVFFVAQ
ncbi:MAG: M14 family metallopeptidase [Saprospiraceae bacterium]|nr:M14 family metallopeptidase [Saprospiraceae bacterium]MDP4820341.1 M14 family metallopeptidase [Saprospiraceae bacterium]